MCSIFMYVYMYVYIYQNKLHIKGLIMDNILIRNFTFFIFFRSCLDLTYTYLTTSSFVCSGKKSLTEVTSGIRKNIKYFWMFNKRHYLTLLKISSSTRYFYYFVWCNTIWRNVCTRADETASDCTWH